MARLQRDPTAWWRQRPWRASRKRNGAEYFLGYFATREEAEQVEREFEATWPPRQMPVRVAS